MKKLAFELPSAMAYQSLAWSHSQLAALATANDERDEHAQKMLQYAKQAATVAEKYEGDWARVAEHACSGKSSAVLLEKIKESLDRLNEKMEVFIEIQKQGRKQEFAMQDLKRVSLNA